ncbi:MAG: class I SAM-dependent methyltransferase [Methylococcaceae bacterium]|nr:class I SAM-dependent methyltransferase [Methylococcaceae bacterium]
MSNEVTSKDYWNKYWSDEVKYPTYDISTGPFYSYHLIFSKYIELVRHRLGKNRLRVIDCGCGEGLILKYLAEQFENLEIWGIEYSDSYYKAKSMGEKLGFDLHLINGDIFSALDPELLESFDVVISVGLIEHFEDPSEIMNQMMRMLTKGGSIVTLIPNFNGLFNLLWKLYDSENYAYHVPIKKHELIQIHNNLGLVDVNFYTLGTPVLSGINSAIKPWQKIIRFITSNVNGRILQRIIPKQSSLEKFYPSTATVACAGFKRR